MERDRERAISSKSLKSRMTIQREIEREELISFSINISNECEVHPLVCRSTFAKSNNIDLHSRSLDIYSTPFAGWRMFDVVHVKSANNNFPTRRGVPFDEFAKRVNLADPKPYIKTFRSPDFLSFIMIHQKLLLRFASHPRRKTSTKLPTSFSKHREKGSPILRWWSSREEQTLLSSPLLSSRHWPRHFALREPAPMSRWK